MTESIDFKRVWDMPNKRTFKIKSIAKFRLKEFKNLDLICDPFPFEGKIDCFDYFDSIEDNSYDKGELDPPFTKRQVSEHYKKNGGICTGWHTSAGWIAKVKKEMTRIIKPGGKVITYAYNSGGLGKCNGFEIQGGLIVCHGAEHNDTICTVDIKTGIK